MHNNNFLDTNNLRTEIAILQEDIDPKNPSIHDFKIPNHIFLITPRAVPTTQIMNCIKSVFIKYRNCSHVSYNKFC